MAAGADVRELALDTLLDIEKNHTLSHVAIGNTLRSSQFMSKQDRALLTRLCEGVMEERIYLTYVIDSVSKTPLHKCKPLIRCLLLMSSYQILCMNIPDRAACNEAVKLAKKRGFTRLSGFVNGVLRNIARNKDSLVIPGKEEGLPKHFSIMYSMPVWLVEWMLSGFGEEQTRAMLAFYKQVRPLSVRVNLSKITPERLSCRLEEEGVRVRPGQYLPYALQLEDVDYLRKLPSFREGLFGVQDESSMLAVEIAQIEKGMTVIDLCAAPGGKTFHAADLTGETGIVYAGDLTEYKTELIEENKQRYGFCHVAIRQWDAGVRQEELLGKGDVVLCDLPCSGLGIMGRKNDIKYHITKEQMEELSRLQRKILSVAWEYVKPGGTLVYSTCTINRNENEENALWLADNTPLVPVSIEEYLPESLRGRTGEQGYLSLIPGVDHCDGFFIARFMRPQT